MRKLTGAKKRQMIRRAKPKSLRAPAVYRPGFKVKGPLAGKGHCMKGRGYHGKGMHGKGMHGKGTRMTGGKFSVRKAFTKVKGASRPALKSYARQSGNQYADVAADLLSKKKSVRKAAVDKAVGLALAAS